MIDQGEDDETPEWTEDDYTTLKCPYPRCDWEEEYLTENGLQRAIAHHHADQHREEHRDERR